ncbi:MAG: hypothetical protein MMC33_001763 [Icmadophila ericetorum]|nr:hypothetical protein [Icmadophila ericetorum]
MRGGGAFLNDDVFLGPPLFDYVTRSLVANRQKIINARPGRTLKPEIDELKGKKSLQLTQ